MMKKPLFAGMGTFRPSRAVAIALIGLGAGIVFFLTIIGATSLMSLTGGIGTGLYSFTIPLISAVLAGILLPARRTRGWFKVMLAKHLFAHRYDYRGEWLRFNDTIGRAGDAGLSLDTRVVKAIADITDSPAGLLLLRQDGGLSPRAPWNWDASSVPSFIPCDALMAMLDLGRIIEIDPLRRDDTATMEEARAIPAWMVADSDIWAIVPLIHFDKLAGAVLLARPAVARTLDWEDFDLLRVVGRQAASYMAEERGQEALADAQRFDEFNRRFAFIMHDIKNLVSQLTLVTRNAERHADKPEFRADMIVTLKSSTARMNDLLARLSQHNTGRTEEPRSSPLGPLVATLASAKRGQHPVVVAGDTGLFGVADPLRLETALAHLLQNAIDASAPNEPVTLTLLQAGEETGIEVSDTGCGMTQDFVRGQLFRPFASTKDGGFGIGAYEARTLVTAMGGRLSVESAIGQGTRFTIWLPMPKRWHEAMVA
jgi:putative PEP-CTERM system histidine kinase